MLSPAALSTLTSTFRATRDRNTALGVWAAVSGLGAAAGVLFGGLLTEGPGMFFFLTLYMQTVLGYSPIQTGTAYLPLPADSSSRPASRPSSLRASAPSRSSLSAQWSQPAASTGSHESPSKAPT